MLSLRNAKCSSPPKLDNYIFKYPQDVAPGDVYPLTRSSLELFTPGTIMFQISDVIIPNMIGTLIFLFFLSTSVFLCFSVLRLIYLDKLKPYKFKKLKALGKHHHYYRHLGDFEGKKVKRYKRKSNTRLRKRKSDEEEEDEEDEGDQASLNHPPGQHISFTTPPQPSEREGNYRDVMDLMHDNENLPQLSKFPVDFPRLYIGGNGQGSRIPILVNKRHSAWGWTSQWYRRQLIDENKTAQAVERLKSSRNLLSARVSEKHLMKPSQERIPSKVIQKHEYPASVQTLYKAPSDLNGPPPSSPEAEIHASVVKVAPSLPPISPPPPVTPVRAEPKIDPSVLEKRSYLQQRQDIAARYTFHLEGLTSALHTEIPKLPPKKSYKQLMILRAGPRKKASQIEEIRQKRKSSLSSETPPPPKDNIPRRKAEDRGKRPT